MTPGEPLAGARIVVTGAARGLGAAAARALAAAGARCVLVDVLEDDLQRLAREIADGRPDAAHPIPGDLADRDCLRRVVETTGEVFGGDLTAFVHCAGVLHPNPVPETTDEEWDRTLAVNLTAAFFLLRGFAEALETGDGGSAVLTSSRAGTQGFPREAAYCASKFGIEGLSQSFAAELKARRVSVNTITPGARIKPTGMTVEEEERLPPEERAWGSADRLGPAFAALALLRGAPTGRRFRADRLAAAVRRHGLPLPETAWEGSWLSETDGDDARAPRRAREVTHSCPIPVADRAWVATEGSAAALPDRALAPGLVERLRRALLGGETHYTARPGLPELRAAIGERLRAAGLSGAGEVVVTAGRREALFVALAGAREAARERSDEGEPPSWPVVVSAAADDPAVANACGALDLLPASGGEAVADLRRCGEPEAGDDGSERTAGALRIVDLGDSLASLPADALRRVPPGAVLVGSLDGWPELAGFRVGFFFAPPAAFDRLRGLKQAVSICTAAPSQRAAALVLGVEPLPAPARPTAAPAARKPEDDGDDSRYSLMELAARLPGVVSLGRGDPDADAPAEVIEEACRTAAAGEPLHPRGQRWLREAIARREAERTGVEWDPEREVLVTGGAQEGIAVAMLALVGPGEEVLLGDPRYTSYETAIRLARGRMVPVPCGAEEAGGREDFGMRADRAEEALTHTSRPRLLVLVNFQNPTGARTGADEVEALCRLADRRHLWVLSDEVYAEMALDGKGPVRSPAAVEGMRPRTLTLGSVSKTWAMTGFRIGYLTGPPDAIEACARIGAALSGPAPLFSQRAAAAAFDRAGEFPAHLRRLYAPRRRMLVDGLERMGIPTAAHGGGFFVWADISRFGLPAERFCRRLLTEARVLVFPGTAFGASWEKWARISMLQSEERIEEALERMARFAGSAA